MNSSDLTLDLTIIFGILMYGAFQYWRRETEHRHTIIRLRKGMELPQQKRKPEVYKLWTTGFVAFLLLACSLGAIMLRPKIRYGGETMLFFATVSFSVFVMLMLILFRDIKARRQHQ